MSRLRKQREKRKKDKECKEKETRRFEQFRKKRMSSMTLIQKEECRAVAIERNRKSHEKKRAQKKLTFFLFQKNQEQNIQNF